MNSIEMPASRKSRKRTQNSLLKVLKDIYRSEITLCKSKNKEILNSILEDFKTESLSHSSLFSCMFKRIYHTGSSYEGLRVKEATEFDINIVFELPALLNLQVKITEVDFPSGFCTVQLNKPISLLLNNCQDAENLYELNSLFDGTFLIGKKLLNWFQSLVDHFRSSWLPLNVKKILIRNSGPACTLKVILENGDFSVDLVPVFEINGQRHLKKLILWRDLLSGNDFKECFIVPKPLKNFVDFNLSADEAQRLWRTHLPFAEKKLLYKRKTLKPIIKLVKDLKEKENFVIPSYCVKTIALWLVKRNPETDYWDESKMDVRFKDVLKFLYYSMTNGVLPHLFYPNFNLLHSINKQSLSSMSERIKKILNHIEKDPRILKTYYLSRCTIIKEIRGLYV